MVTDKFARRMCPRGRIEVIGKDFKYIYLRSDFIPCLNNASVARTRLPDVFWPIDEPDLAMA